MLSPAVREKLSQSDWSRLGQHVTLYAYRKLGKSVIGGAPPTPELLRQKAEDVASEVIVSVTTGRRKWNPEEQPDLLNFLKNVADSQISHFLNGSQNRFERQAPEEGLEVTTTPNPDSDLIYQDMRARLGDESDLVEFLDAIHRGSMTAGEIADELGISCSEAINRRKRLRRRAKEMGYLPHEEVTL